MPSGVWLFLALAFGISWLAYLVRRFGDPTAEIDEMLRLVVKFGPSIAGLISATWMAGAAGAWAILRRLVPSWRDAKWIAFALVMPLAVMAVATLLRVLSATEPIVANDWRVPTAATGFFSLLATRFFAGGGLGEELGWRGFMQPQLMGCMSPLRTSLLIGAFHALWHLPAFGPSVLLLAGFTIAMAITATWMYERCAGNLFPIALLHATGNASIAWVERLYPALDNDIRLVLITFVLWLGFAVILVATARVKAAVVEE